MPVPNTNTFSLQDVVDNVLPSSNDLVDCISDAQASLYDPTYYTAPATNLLEFRNYGAGAAWSVYSINRADTFDITSLAGIENNALTTTCWVDSGGTRMYLIDYNNKTVKQFSLSVAHDLSSTISLVGTSSALSFFTIFCVLNPSGTYAYIRNGSTLQQHALSTAWDITTMSTSATNTLALPTQNAFGGVAFNGDGTILYHAYQNSTTSYQASYSLSTAYDISTAGAPTINDIESTMSVLPQFIMFVVESTDNVIISGNSGSVNAYRNGITNADLDSTRTGWTVFLPTASQSNYFYASVRSGTAAPYTWTIEKYNTNV